MPPATRAARDPGVAGELLEAQRRTAPGERVGLRQDDEGGVAQQRLGHEIAAVPFASVALFILVLSALLLGARVTRRQAAGVGVAIAALVGLIANQVGLDGDANLP